MKAVTLMADTSTAIEKVQKYANSSAAFRMQNQMEKNNADGISESIYNAVDAMTQPQNIQSENMQAAGNTTATDNATDMKTNMENEIQNLTASFQELETAVKAFGNAEVLAGLEEYESVYEEYSTKIQSVLSSDSNSIRSLMLLH